MRIILHSVAFVLLLAQGAFGQTEDWTMAKSEDGITVYTRPVDGSSIDEFRAETIIQGSIKDMERVLKDADNMVKWSPDSEESKLLSLEGNEQIYYLERTLRFRSKIAMYAYYSPTMNCPASCGWRSVLFQTTSRRKMVWSGSNI